MEFNCPRCGHCCPQPNQEPDFWALFDENQRLRAELKFNTTSPQQWVGLTDEDKAEIFSRKWWNFEDEFDLAGFLGLVEAKLKEKNT